MKTNKTFFYLHSALTRCCLALLLGGCCFFCNVVKAGAQLWEVPPLPSVKYAPAPDGMTATIGSESLHISVCRASVIHFVATPEQPMTGSQSKPWMLDPKGVVPGRKV